MVCIDSLAPQQKYGYDWECYMAEKLSQFGHVTHLANECFTTEFDLKLNNKLIHCKAAKRKAHHNGLRCLRWRYQFNFRMVANGDFIIAICDKYGEPVHFIIPVCELQKKSLSITSNPLIYSGWAAKYREQWSLLK